VSFAFKSLALDYYFRWKLLSSYQRTTTTFKYFSFQSLLFSHSKAELIHGFQQKQIRVLDRSKLSYQTTNLSLHWCRFFCCSVLLTHHWISFICLIVRQQFATSHDDDFTFDVCSYVPSFSSLYELYAVTYRYQLSSTISHWLFSRTYRSHHHLYMERST
jgi:hypothetical protein